MEHALRALLAADTAVAAIVPIARINWRSHPQGAGLPAIVLRTISGVDGAHMQGPNGILEARVQVDCYAMKSEDAAQLGRAVKKALHFHRGGNFLGVFHAGTRDGREGGSNEAERPFYVGMDFTLTWRETNG